MSAPRLIKRVIGSRAESASEYQGLAVSSLGFGGAALGGLFESANSEQSIATLSAALDVGVSYVDTAPFYGFGRSERVVGNILRDRDYVLSTKVGRLLRPGALDNPEALGWSDALPFHPCFDYSYDGVMRSFEDSLQRLGLDRIDILYVHDIGTMTHGSENSRHFADLCDGGYRALEALRDCGAIKAIGLGVNEVAVCCDALNMGDWDVFLLAGRYTLLEQSPLDELFPQCMATDTAIVIGGPYNSGVLVGGENWNYGAVPTEIDARVAALKQVAVAHDVPLSAAALQFPMAHPLVVSVIPGLRSVDEWRATLDWAQIDIPAAFWCDLKAKQLLHSNAPVPQHNPFMQRLP